MTVPRTARVDALAPARQRLTDVSSQLRNFSITTWDVAPDALARHLPPGFTPEVGRIDGRDRAFVSAVSFVNTRFFVGFAPFIKLTCQQTNYRAYVRRGGEQAVWFFGTSLASRFVLLPRHAWSLPWHRVVASCAADWDGEHLVRLDWRGDAEEGEERLVATGTGESVRAVRGFDDAAAGIRILTHPLVGYVRRRDGRVATYGVSHTRLEMEVATATEARYEVFERAGVVERDQAPHSVLVQRATHFVVLLPPKKLKPQPSAALTVPT